MTSNVLCRSIACKLGAAEGSASSSLRNLRLRSESHTLAVRSAQNGARSSRLRIFPEPVFGSSSIHEIDLGTL